MSHAIPLVIHSPRDFQVFQRRSLVDGEVFVSGRAAVGTDSLSVRLEGDGYEGDWEVLDVDPVTGAFADYVEAAPGGWYRLEAEAAKSGSTSGLATVAHVGVGEVFVGAGQSNSTNCGGEGPLQVASKRVATFDGTLWRIAHDPQPGVHDGSEGGSFWPAFGDDLAERLDLPIGVAVTGHGGSSVDEWTPQGELFPWTMTRIWQLGPCGFRALLWHQGESDVEMTSEQYFEKLSAVILATKVAAGWEFPWMVAQVSYHSPEATRHDSTRDAHRRLWELGVALEGPDTDTLGGDNRDEGGLGIHFSTTGLRNHGRMWAECVAGYLAKLEV